MSEILSLYAHDDLTYHELMDHQGTARPHWQHLLQTLQSGSAAQWNHRQALVERQIQEHGITHNLYADFHGTDRPWTLDLLPQVLPADEWQVLAQGVAQRAQLLNEVLVDLYGPQTLLREGLLPPELIFGHRQFVWPCQGMQVPGNHWLHLYAVDVARAPDGRWWVLADRTQARLGIGYALENRQIISRVLPELYRDLRVRHLTDFFRGLQLFLCQLAPSQAEIPLVVMLTPGRMHDAYFEHLYLARQLGFPLVESNDLTVRGDSVYLKTLNGLKRVHAIVRRLEDDQADPLELRSDTVLGIPGLLHVARQGRVLIANALGSGVLESTGLLGFLPAVSQRLLGAKLQLPNIATWWCGEPLALQYALDHLPNLVIKPAFASQSFQPVFAGDLDAAGLHALAQRLRARPYSYAAQERVHLSHAAVWDGQKLQSRVMGIRLYAIATAEGYRVMPGGLTRVATQPNATVVSFQRGGSSKDTWVLGESVADKEAWSAGRALSIDEVIRSDPYLPSRVVENLFWFGRYSERCDDGARLLRVLLSCYVDDDNNDPEALKAALELGVLSRWLPPGQDLEQALHRGLLGEDWSYSLKANLAHLQWASGQVRGKLSQENWQAMVQLQHAAQLLEQEQGDWGALLDVLNQLLMSLAALSGFALDDMTRDDGWRFLMLGRRIERLRFLAESVAVFLKSSGVYHQAALEWLLELGNSIITYRSRYLAAPQLAPVLDLLLLDPENPHALMFLMQELDESLGFLNQRFALMHDNPLTPLAAQLFAFDLRGVHQESVDATQTLAGLADLLKNVHKAAGVLSDQLALKHFAHVDARSQQIFSS